MKELLERTREMRSKLHDMAREFEGLRPDWSVWATSSVMSALIKGQEDLLEYFLKSGRTDYVQCSNLYCRHIWVDSGQQAECNCLCCGFRSR